MQPRNVVVNRFCPVSRELREAWVVSIIMCQVQSRRVVACVIGLGTAALALLTPLSPFATAAPIAPGVSPVKVDANYKITLNGFDLGSFRFQSNVGRNEYSLDTDVQISALLGVFKWRGVTHSSGLVKAKSPKPSDFRFNYESSVRSGSVSMGFGQEGVETLKVLPAMMEAPDTVPLTRSHIQGVLDPLTAILAITHTDAPAPCGRKVAIFDGKQRFDLELRYARQEAVPGVTGETAVVCRVKYTPIAGYRPTEETRELAASNGIEISFRIIPTAKLMLPQSVTVPTAAGEARINLERVNIELPQGQLASVD